MYGFKILCEISKPPFEISHKILNPYTAQYAFYVLNFDEWWYFKTHDIISLSETGSSTPTASASHLLRQLTSQWLGVGRDKQKLWLQLATCKGTPDTMDICY